ncbi:39S ribosomal protein L1, mitochondrial-like [Pollicipes pollicipes]|uniref:39S ribosomal protein L1, mitochondrial-like n=1 Tax=Pollicipes pollicipes TaxID=41117 RepID=UPI00188598F1|nr:39S ribosomal protein L1, mitochondrial-like [Pollicipes pollicipes]XP_037076624.1 39S ribosomal protein L1, mitochondrial-like [Pollicipes pollicipes]
MLSPLRRLGGPLLTQARRAVSTSAPLAAARKGTRERKKAKIVKKEEVKTEWVPENVRRAELLNQQPYPDRRVNRYRLPEPVDDVYVRNWFRWPEYRMEQAVEMHRETHHPTVYNRPHELLFATIELDMQMDKRTRFADPVRQVVTLPHAFEFAAPREVAVFCQSAAARQLAEQIGVTVYGGSELIKQFQSGAMMADDFDYFVAHPEMMSELVAIRGLLRRRFPSLRDGSLTVDLAAAVDRFRSGLEYASERDERQPDFAQVVAPVGKLSMPTDQLIANLTALLTDLQAARPRGHTRPFVTRVSSWCQPAPEKFDIDFAALLEPARAQAQADVDPPPTEAHAERV